MIRAIALSLALFAVAGPAAAQTADIEIVTTEAPAAEVAAMPALRAAVTVTADVVRIGIRLRY